LCNGETRINLGQAPNEALLGEKNMLRFILALIHVDGIRPW